MRVLGLDYGSARCGCALADPTGTIVTPIDAVARPATRRGLDALAALVAEREVERVVVGLPLTLSGKESAQTRETKEFAARLARRLGEGVPVELHDERLTTRMAQRMGVRSPAYPPASASEDSRAAALMLESWLSASSATPDGGSRTARQGPAASSSLSGGCQTDEGSWPSA
jgi:putative holliday junction resolvase